MNTVTRRGFLGLLAGASAAVVAGIELPELFVPQRTIFLPPAGGWLDPHVFITSLWADEIVRQYKENLVMSTLIQRMSKAQSLPRAVKPDRVVFDRLRCAILQSQPAQLTSLAR